MGGGCRGVMGYGNECKWSEDSEQCALRRVSGCGVDKRAGNVCCDWMIGC
jgi:hypothetical protein